MRRLRWTTELRLPRRRVRPGPWLVLQIRTRSGVLYVAKIRIEDSSTVFLWCPPNSTSFDRPTLSAWLTQPHGSITVNGAGFRFCAGGTVELITPYYGAGPVDAPQLAHLRNSLG